MTRLVLWCCDVIGAWWLWSVTAFTTLMSGLESPWWLFLAIPLAFVAWGVTVERIELERDRRADEQIERSRVGR